MNVTHANGEVNSRLDGLAPVKKPPSVTDGKARWSHLRGNLPFAVPDPLLDATLFQPIVPAFLFPKRSRFLKVVNVIREEDRIEPGQNIPRSGVYDLLTGYVFGIVLASLGHGVCRWQ